MKISCAINGVTAYEDDEGKRITSINILKFIKENKPNTFLNVYNNIMTNFEKIKDLVYQIPNEYNDVQIKASNRKEYIEK